MFFKTILEDDFRIEPHEFDRVGKSLSNKIRGKYVDRVIPGCGLCVSLVAVLSTSNVDIPPRSGGSWSVSVKFSVCVFCPFVGELMIVPIAEQSSHGIRFSAGFFDDIYMLPYEIGPPGAEASFNKQSRWEVTIDQDGGGGGKKGRNAFVYQFPAQPDVFRVCVTKVEFHRPEAFVEQHRLTTEFLEYKQRQQALFDAPDEEVHESGQFRHQEKATRKLNTPTTAQQQQAALAREQLAAQAREITRSKTKFHQPMTVYVTMKALGLGDPQWWQAQDDRVPIDEVVDRVVDRGGWKNLQLYKRAGSVKNKV